MKCVLALLAFAFAVGVVTPQIPPYTVFPSRSRMCCAQAHQCYSRPPWNIRCRFYSRPVCRARFHRPCRQSLKLLRKVWVRFSNNQRRCCRVLNCRKIYYSKCSFCTDKCPFYQRICTPHYYRRYRLRLACPGVVGFRTTWRYFPHCCVCRYCPLRYYPTLPWGRGK